LGRALRKPEITLPFEIPNRGQLREFFRMLHGLQQSLAIENVDVDVMSAIMNIAIQHE
jgi:hypothetical protein